MEEIYEEPSSDGPDLQRYLGVVRRRHIHFLVPFFLGWLLVWGASWVMSPRYKSSTLILVEQPTMPKSYVEPNVNEDLQGRLASIEQQILSRTRLLLIIDKLHLYNDSRAETSPDQKVELMTKDIEIQLVRPSEGAPITAFKIYYSASDPHVAQQVTRELTDLFINENLKVRQQESQGTTAFIESQLETARTTLAEQEAKVKEFEGAHLGELPTQQTTNLQILSGLQSQLQSEQDTLNSARQQRVYLQTMIDQYRSLRGSPGEPTDLDAIERRLDGLRSQLNDLSTRYTDEHPSIRNLKAQIANTEKMKDDLLARSTGTANSGKQLADARPAGGAQGSTSLQLQSQLQANQAEIANRERAISELKSRVNDYQARLNNAPAREQQLADLTRGYEQSKENFDDLLKKKNQSAMATSMEQMQQGERFTMLDPPSLPENPYSPDRLKLCGIGIGVGFALGLVFVIGLELMDDRMHNEKEIKVLLPVAIISEIPEIVNPSDQELTNRKLVFGWAMAATVTAMILAGSAFSYLRN